MHAASLARSKHLVGASVGVGAPGATAAGDVSAEASEVVPAVRLQLMRPEGGRRQRGADGRHPRRGQPILGPASSGRRLQQGIPDRRAVRRRTWATAPSRPGPIPARMPPFTITFPGRCTWHRRSLAAWNSVRVPVSTWSTADTVLSPQPTNQPLSPLLATRHGTARRSLVETDRPAPSLGTTAVPSTGN